MTQKKEYIFEYIHNPNVQIVIKCYGYMEAITIMVDMPINEYDFKCISV